MYDLHRVPLGIYEKALPDALPWAEKLADVRQAGFDYLELSVDESDARLARLDWAAGELRSLRRLSEDCGVPLPTLCLSAHRRYPLGSKNPAVRERAFEIMEKAIRLSCRLGVRCIQLASYDVYYEESDQETEALFLDGLRRSVDLAARAGVVLALEIMDTPFMGTILRATRYLRAIPSPYLQLYPDLGNLTRFSGDPSAELELGLSRIAAVHVKETAPGRFKGVPFGQGTVPFEELFRTLRRLGYSGMFLVEMWADNTPGVGSARSAAALRQAREFVADRLRLAGYGIPST